MQGPSSGSTTAGPPCLTSLPSPLPPNYGARRRTARATTTAGLPQAILGRNKTRFYRGRDRSLTNAVTEEDSRKIDLKIST